MQAIEGYYKEGLFYPLNPPINLPDYRRVIITVLDEPISKKLMNAMPMAANDSEETRKKEALRRLCGSCKDPTMVEPPEIPLEYELPRGLI